MRNWSASFAAVAALLFIFVLGGVQREISGRDRAASWSPIAAAEAAGGVCPVPSLKDVPGTWVVKSAACTGEACRRAHFAAGDLVRFDRDISGEANFSVDVQPQESLRRRTRSEGYSLRSDGVAGIKGAVVLDHDVYDGSPLDLHWLIVQIRSYYDDASASCKLTGRVQICGSEPAAGAAACNAKQHEGTIIVGPP